MTSEQWIQLLSFVIPALLGSIPGVLAFRKQLRADRALSIEKEAVASERITAAAIALIDPYRVRLETMELVTAADRKKISELERSVAHYRGLAELSETTTRRLDCLEKDMESVTEKNRVLESTVRELEVGIDALVLQLEAAKMKPVWTRKKTIEDHS